MGSEHEVTSRTKNPKDFRHGFSAIDADRYLHEAIETENRTIEETILERQSGGISYSQVHPVIHSSAQTSSLPTDDGDVPASTQVTEEQLEELRNEIAGVQMRIHQLENEQRDAIEEKNFAEASRLEEEIKPHKEELQALQIKKNQTKRLPSTINETASNEEHRFTYRSAQKVFLFGFFFIF